MVDFRKVGENIQDFAQSTSQSVGSEFKNFGNRVKQSIEDFTTPQTVGRARRTSGNLPPDGTQAQPKRTTAEYSQPPETKDWRVRLSLPNTSTYRSSPLLNPLRVTNGLTFPYTPTIILQSQVNYNSMDPIHSNFQFHSFENSMVQPIQITGTFIVQNQDEARYWIGAVHYLRSITKMAYGESIDRGQPPPVVRLNGYGDYVFKDVPVVVQNFMTDLPADADYISTGLEAENSDNSSAVGWAPVRSEITINVIPMYSRRTVEQFSLDAFVRGDYVKNNKGFI